MQVDWSMMLMTRYESCDRGMKVVGDSEVYTRFSRGR